MKPGETWPPSASDAESWRVVAACESAVTGTTEFFVYARREVGS